MKDGRKREGGREQRAPDTDASLTRALIGSCDRAVISRCLRRGWSPCGDQVFGKLRLVEAG